jgi:negative regulator of sigma E activity
MQGATADGEMVMTPAGLQGFARRRLALLGVIAVVLFAVAFGVGSMVKSHTAQQASSASLVSTTPVAGSPHLTIVKVRAGTTVPVLRTPAHKPAKVKSASSTNVSTATPSVTPTSPQVTPVTPQVTPTTPHVVAPPPPQSHTTAAQTSTTGGGLSGGSS